ncbi:hypothetical protein [Lentzea terrae]|uniref:hypothetical protein n=1 Tax=Lentzea terrae TaxID=2200761 RepID=UPI002FCDB150
MREEAAAALARGHAPDVWRTELARLVAVEEGLCFGRLDRSAAGATPWERVPRPHRLAQLTVNHCTPAEIVEVAAQVLAGITPGCVRRDPCGPAASLRAGSWSRSRYRRTSPRNVVLLTPAEVKGLEFDVVVIVDPARSGPTISMWP